MTENIWYGKEFTKIGVVLIFINAPLSLLVHEFGHVIAYLFFGIPCAITFETNLLPAFIVKTSVHEIPLWITDIVAFCGGGFVFVVYVLLAIKIRPLFFIAISGIITAILEVITINMSILLSVNHIVFINSNLIAYSLSLLILLIITTLIGFPEFKSAITIRIPYRHQ